jgi:LuxR family quorum sensing-dependent transcriptional regulator
MLASRKRAPRSMNAAPSNRAFEFIERADALDSPDALVAAFREVAEAYGFSALALGELPGPHSSELKPFFVSTWPESWLETYIGEGFAAADPTVETARSATLPTTWSAFRERAERRSPALRVLDAAAAGGWPEGVIIPIHGPRGYHGAVTVAGHRARLSPRERATLHLAALYLHERLRNLLVPEVAAQPQDLPRLTDGEVACIEWLIAGKSDWEIGEILGIAQSTAHYRIERAKLKFGVKTRAQLTALAVAHGYIRL